MACIEHGTTKPQAVPADEREVAQAQCHDRLRHDLDVGRCVSSLMALRGLLASTDSRQNALNASAYCKVALRTKKQRNNLTPIPVAALITLLLEAVTPLISRSQSWQPG